MATYDMPVILNTSWTVRAGQDSSPSRLADMVNAYKQPMLIDEIRFAATPAPGGGTLPYGRIFRSSVRMALGRFQITNEFIPMDVLAPRAPGPGEVILPLSRPLYMGNTYLLEPTIRSTVDFTMNLTLVGRLTEPVALGAKQWVPFISAWQTPTASTVGQTLNVKSPRSAFVNRFRTPLYVKRFVGYRAIGGGLATGAIDISVSNYLGKPVLRDPTPFYELFTPVDRMWAVETELPPAGFFMFSAAVAGTNFGNYGRISMFGYREEQL